MANQQSASVGMNKTGIETSRKLSDAMIESSKTGPVAGDGFISPAELRTEYIKEGVRIGSVPPPKSMKGVAKTAMQALKGEKANVLIDKIGERLAFERTGTRLYEALLVKCRAQQATSGPVIADVEKIRDEELQHFHLLWSCLETLGADPTVETPSADVGAVASEGIPKVLADPRTTVPQCLDAILAAELVDNAGWEMLVELADEFGRSDMAEKFRKALSDEENHLRLVRDWLTQGIREEARVV